ncbi:MAG: TIGR01777 family oxidoreductase [Bacteroidales bacterium]|nr:TIGR01777 family oxidoreductase [Bacteroidales bacterium]
MKKRKVVLITGGSGLIGRRLTEILNSAGYSVRILSRRRVLVPGARVFLWDHRLGTIEEGALDDISIIIHLAGTNIGAERWNEKGKKSIIESRVGSARFIHREISERGITPDLFISASATGYYGAETTDRIFTEDDPPGTGFASLTTQIWEEEANSFSNVAGRTAIVRTGIVLSSSGGMLQRIIPTVKMHFSPLFGNGDQWMPWIHIDDIAAVYLRIIEDESLNGIINGVSPFPVTYDTLVRGLSEVMGMRVFSPPTPEFLWKLIFREKAGILLYGSRVSAEKLLNSGFSFSFPDLQEALSDLLH